MKHYGLYDAHSTRFVLGGMGVLYVLTIGLCAFFIKQFVFDPIAAAGTPDWSVIPLLVILILPPFAIIPVLSHKSRALGRYLLRCRFSEEGIFCFGLFWKSFLIPWERIRTYGLQGYSYAHVSMVFLFFAAEKEYYKKETIAQISEKRIVFQLRDEIVPALFAFMPPDMKARLEEAIDRSRDVYVQR